MPGPRAGRKLHQLQVPPMERVVLLHTKVSIPSTIFLFDLLEIFFLMEMHRVCVITHYGAAKGRQ